MGECRAMHALFEESGKFLAGRILSEADTSAQVELRSEEHTSELQSQSNLVCRLLLEKNAPTSAKDTQRPECVCWYIRPSGSTSSLSRPLELSRPTTHPGLRRIFQRPRGALNLGDAIH